MSVVKRRVALRSAFAGHDSDDDDVADDADVADVPFAPPLAVEPWLELHAAATSAATKPTASSRSHGPALVLRTFMADTVPQFVRYVKIGMGPAPPTARGLTLSN